MSSLPADKLNRPEIEASLMSAGYLLRLESLRSIKSSVDILEVPQDPNLGFSCLEGLDHNGLISHFETIDNKGEGWINPLLRMIFLNPIMRGNSNTHVPQAHPSTLDWLQTRFSLSSLFIDSIVKVSYGAKSGDLCFLHHGKDGKIDRIDGFYCISIMSGPSHVWFTHNLVDKSSLYVISSCLQISKNRIFRCVKERNFDVLRRPMVVDAFIADAVSWGGRQKLEEERSNLMVYENRGAASSTSETLTTTFQNLHRLSQKWHILSEDLMDFEERLQFLLGVLEKIKQRYDDQGSTHHTMESFTHLLSRNQVWKRWSANYNARTKIRIDLFFNLASQGDNHTNLEIASISKKIAEETRKDSSSMITIAAVTMLFLPGTFICAIFSTVFFDTKTDENGDPRLVVASTWWYFPAIAIPLTVLIMLIWAVWQRSRGIRKGFIPAKRGFDHIITGRIRQYFRHPSSEEQEKPPN